MFVYECKTHKKDCLVLFLGQYDKKSKESLASTIQEAYKNHLTPELVFFVFPSYIKQEILKLLKLKSIETDLTRYKHSPVICLSFNVCGEFNVEQTLNGLNCKIPRIDCSLIAPDLVEYGFKHLMDQRRNDVLVKSPAGTTFVKPSGKELEEFIYASQLARNSFEHQFLAMALLKHVPDPTKIDVIHIDTASIASIAEAVVYYISKFEGTNCKHITYQSFSSYTGLEDNLKPDNVSGAWVIISASASLSMGIKLVKDWGIKPEQVVTILSYKPLLPKGDRNTGNDVVFCLESYSKRDKKSFSPTKVQVQGESFAVEVSNLQKISLGINHNPKYIGKSISKYYDTKTFKLNKNNLNNNTKPLYVDYCELRKVYLDENGKIKLSSDLYKWMKQIAEWIIPKNISTIISNNDTPDKQFQSDFKYILEVCKFDIKKLKTISFDNQDAMERIKKRPVLVLSSAISTGRLFVDSNRALRLAGHTGMRIFITSFVTAPSHDQFRRFSSSLVRGINNFNYAFFYFKSIYTGENTKSSWQKELEIVKELVNNDKDGRTNYWQTRKKQLEKKGDGLNDFIGLHYKSKLGKFSLASDFVFWPQEYKSQNISLPAVYATICVILQFARENEVNGSKLSANVYQHCVIDPENFVRFNDSILQSCLWRCALPNELDYRSSDALSRDIQSILIKMFQSCNSERGVTSLDLLMGLATQWIKISDDSMQSVLKSAGEHLKAPHAKLLIKYMKKEFKP